MKVCFYHVNLVRNLHGFTPILSCSGFRVSAWHEFDEAGSGGTIFIYRKPNAGYSEKPGFASRGVNIIGIN